MVNFSAN